MNRTTHPIEPEEVMAYLDNELAAERAAYVAAHIEACADCAALVADLRGVSARVATWTVAPASPSLNSAIEAAASELRSTHSAAVASAAGTTKSKRVVRPASDVKVPLPNAGQAHAWRSRVLQWAWGLAGSFAVISLIVAVAIPNLLRSRITANETSAVGNVRALNTACVQYLSKYGKFPDSLAQLGPGNPPSENAADLIDSVLASGRKSGYVFTYRSQGFQGYEITAEPLERNETGVRSFYADQSGIVRQDPNGPANATSVAVAGYEPIDGLVGVSPPSNEQGSLPVEAGHPAFAPGGGIVSPTGPMIIRTASLAILTREFDDVRAAMEKIVSGHGGYAGQLNVNSQPGRGRTLKATVRIPTSKVDLALAELKKLGRVVQESQSGEEITQQYVDLVARQDNGRHIEKRLVEVLRNRTGKVKEVLEVEQEIARVREEIERMEAKRKSMAAQVEYATVSLELREEFEKQMEVAPPSTGTLLWNAMVDGYDSAVATAVGLALFLLRAGPSLLLWAALLFFPARLAWRRIRTVNVQ